MRYVRVPGFLEQVEVAVPHRGTAPLDPRDFRPDRLPEDRPVDDLPLGLETPAQLAEPFCACGHVVSRCDRSRAACRRGDPIPEVPPVFDPWAENFGR